MLLVSPNWPPDNPLELTSHAKIIMLAQVDCQVQLG